MPNGPVRPSREDLVHGWGVGAVRGAKHADAALARLRDEDVPVGGRAHQAGTLEARDELAHREPGEDREGRARGAVDRLGAVARRRGGIGGGKLGKVDHVLSSREVAPPVVGVAGLRGRGRLRGRGGRRDERREEGDDVAPRVGHGNGDRHEGPGDSGGGRREETVQGGRVPGEARVAERLRVVEVRQGGGPAAHHPDEARALPRYRLVARPEDRRMAERAALLEEHLPVGGVARRLGRGAEDGHEGAAKGERGGE